MNIHKIDTFSGHRDSIYTIIQKHTDSQFYSAGGDGFIILWDLTQPDLGKLIARAGASVYALAYDPTREQLWIGQNYEGIQLLDTKTNTILKTAKITSASIFDIQLVNDKALIALGDGVLMVMDIPSFSVQKHIKLSSESIRCIAVSPDQREFAVGDSQNRVHIFDLQDYHLKQTIGEHGNSVFTLNYSPDGRYLLSSGRDAHIKIWDATTDYQLIQDIPAHMYAINHLTFSPDGAYFSTASMDKSIKIWQTEGFRLKKVIDRGRHAGHGTSVNKLLWSNYHNQLVSCSDDRTISVWEVQPYETY
ncbi:WD domain G-beta repeat uncharacterized protein [Dyadobacter jejuensis]|uniref:WD domain G-beta repeat uncharacterized protein n=1 Tax=Dyadobacter jejuensis TaxID=1082580 RepID=A0A316AWH9_9BACT|nr:WD40 repeat domain-containing protein [Dyadobacter jejuensis]PWJ54517.1 WD domain G-beta repeat uncharacterized protein [Dyadobacter jejuensis]